MIAEVTPLVESASSWIVLGSTCLAVISAVFPTCWRVVRWIDRQEDRWEAVDTVVADWHARGLTPRGAVEEHRKYRDRTDANTAAIAAHGNQLNDHELRIGRLERADAA